MQEPHACCFDLTTSAQNPFLLVGPTDLALLKMKRSVCWGGGEEISTPRGCLLILRSLLSPAPRED